MATRIGEIRENSGSSQMERQVNVYTYWRWAHLQKFVRGCHQKWRGCCRLTNFFTLRFSEFMFWGCFSYDRKGSCAICRKETAAEKNAADKHIAKLNKEAEGLKKAEWELNTAMRRTGLRNKRGKKPQWRWNQKNGKIIRGGTGEIDWVRYQKHVLSPLLIPFAKICLQKRLDTLVMEDGDTYWCFNALVFVQCLLFKASSHISKNQNSVWIDAGILRLIWYGNSPDLNIIEPCWW